jgi:hypothetical protein
MQVINGNPTLPALPPPAGQAKLLPLAIVAITCTIVTIT